MRANTEIISKPIFNSGGEYTVYAHLVQIFPNHLVFPNMALQAIFQYSRMKELISRADFQYYLMAMVDFCITSTVNYIPIMAVEVDSHYHEEPEQKERDKKKDRIFQTGGVPLLRIRAHGQPTEASLRNQLSRAIEVLITDTPQDDRSNFFNNAATIKALAAELNRAPVEEHDPSVPADSFSGNGQSSFESISPVSAPENGDVQHKG